VDDRISRHGGALTALRCKVALASAHLAYAAFLDMARTDRWRALEAKGAKPPPATLWLFEDHGRVSRTLGEDDAAEARRLMKALADGGIDFADVNHTLEDAGIEKFIKSFDSLLDVIASRRRALWAGLD